METLREEEMTVEAVQDWLAQHRAQG